MLLLMVVSEFAPLPLLARPQAPNSSESSSAELPTSPGSTPVQPALTYTRPTEKTKLHNYFFDAFPIAGAAIAAGINQAERTPPEWEQGAEGYGKRFGSNFAIAAVSTTARYTLAKAFGEDTLYYRCGCKGLLPRLNHAVISTFTARRGDDGHRVFSFPALSRRWSLPMPAP